MDKWTTVLAGMAAMMHVIAYAVYNIQAMSGASKPNSASWSIWAFSSVLNASSYRAISGDTLVALQSIAGSAACSLTFIFVLIMGKFSWSKPKEWAVLATGILAMVVWQVFKTAAGANLIVLAAVLISFYPTLKGVWQDPAKETGFPWIVWTIAFLITGINVILRGSPLIALIMPAVLFLAHGTVAVLCRKSRQDKFRLTTN